MSCANMFELKITLHVVLHCKFPTDIYW